jgi:hypothetical protein
VNTPARVEPDAPPAVVDEPGSEYATLWKVAQRTSKTAMIPKELRGRPEETFAVMAYGWELGVGPMASVRSIHMIEGVPTCSAQLMRSLIQGAGHLVQFQEVSDRKVVVQGRRRDTGAHLTVTWTLDDARRAKLLGRGNWATYPRAMLAARATSELGRLLFADVLGGISYTPEEAGAPAGPWDAIDVASAPATDQALAEVDERFNVDRDTGEILDEPDPGRPFTDDEEAEP